MRIASELIKKRLVINYYALILTRDTRMLKSVYFFVYKDARTNRDLQKKEVCIVLTLLTSYVHV